jgi:hypothetical protein
MGMHTQTASERGLNHGAGDETVSDDQVRRRREEYSDKMQIFITDLLTFPLFLNAFFILLYNIRLS